VWCAIANGAAERKVASSRKLNKEKVIRDKCRKKKSFSVRTSDRREDKLPGSKMRKMRFKIKKSEGFFGAERERERESTKKK
jgi:hypothetical protein